MTTHPPAERRPTIMEVARLAGVSHQTVSRYLRFNGEGLKPKTRDSVESAIAQLNYRPNLLARSMRTRVTGRIAVVMPALAFNPARMLSGATRRAHEAGYQVEVISPEGGPAERAERILELADTRLVDGILSLSPVDLGSLVLPTDTVLVVSADFDDEMRGIGELADATPIGELIGGSGRTRASPLLPRRGLIAVRIGSCTRDDVSENAREARPRIDGRFRRGLVRPVGVGRGGDDPQRRRADRDHRGQ